MTKIKLHTPKEIKPQKQFYIYLPILLFFAYFPTFLELNDQSMRMWDESFYAINAYEMMNNGDILSQYFSGMPIYEINLKPPLMTWLQVLSFKTFGVGEFAIRFPSALAGLILMILLLSFIYRNVKIPLWGLIAGLMLATTPGFISNHVVRTGDCDTLLTLFLFLSLWQFYRYLTSDKSQNKHLYFTSLFIILAAYTKGMAGLMFLPAMVILGLVFRKFIPIIKSKELYISILVFIVLFGGFYFLKDRANPGYLDSWLKNESIGRFSNAVEGHSHPFFYYFSLLIKGQFLPWILLLPLSLLFYFKEKNTQIRDLLKFSLIAFLGFIIFISLAQSKLEWYTAPILPFLAILSGYGLYKIIDLVIDFMHINNWINTIGLSFGLVVLSLLFPYINTIKHVTNPETNWAANKYGDYMKHLKNNYPDFKKFTLFHNGFNTHAVYYTNVYNQEYGYNIDYKMIFHDRSVYDTVYNGIKAGDKVMLYQLEILEDLRKKFDVNVFNHYEELKLVDVKLKAEGEEKTEGERTDF